MEPYEPKRRGRNKPVQHQDPFADEAAGVTDFAQLALYMAASLAGMVTAVLVSRRPFFESLMAKIGGGKGGGKSAPAGRPRSGRGVVRPSPEESLPMLAEAIIGNTKAAVASVFGPPRSAALRGVVKSGPKAPGYWHANTWYYALPRSEELAMAIEFADDAARRVEFFRAPGFG